MKNEIDTTRRQLLTSTIRCDQKPVLVEKSIFQHVRKRVFNHCRSHGVLIVVETYLPLKVSVGISVSPSVNSRKLKAVSRKGSGGGYTLLPSKLRRYC